MLAELQKLIPGNGKRIVRETNAYNGDLRKQIEKDFQLAKLQTKGIASRFKGANDRETAQNVHSFLRRNLVYLKDKPGVQQVQLPSSLLKNLTGDCKSFSLFAAALLSNLELPTFFKYASYVKTNPVPTHIYVTVKDGNNKEIIVDGTNPLFDNEKPPAHSFYKDLSMRVETLSDEVLAEQVIASQVLADEQLSDEAGKAFFKRMKLMNPTKRIEFLKKFTTGNRAKLMRSLRSTGKLMKLRNIGATKAGQKIAIQADPYDPFCNMYYEDCEVDINGPKFKKKRLANKQEKLKKAKPGSNRAKKLDRKVQKLTIKSTKTGSDRKAAMKTFRKEVRRPQIKAKAAKVGKILNKINPVLGIGRGAFLALLRLNMRGMATKMAKLKEKNQLSEIYKKWESIGGKKDRLDKGIEKGKGKRALFDLKANRAAKKADKGLNDEYLADGGATAAITAASATPVLAIIIPVLSKLLKKNGEDDSDLDGIQSDAENGKKQPAFKKFIEKVKGVLNKPGVKSVTTAGLDALDNFIQDKFLETEGEPGSSEDGPNDTDEGGGTNKLLIGGAIAAGLAAAFLLSKKK